MTLGYILIYAALRSLVRHPVRTIREWREMWAEAARLAEQRPYRDADE